VRTDGAVREAQSVRYRFPVRFALLLSGGLAVIGGITVAALYLIDVVAEATPYRTLENRCKDDGYPVPWAGWEELRVDVERVVGGSSGEEAFASLASLLSSRPGLIRYKGAQPPTVFRTAGEIHRLESGGITGIEAVAYLLAASFHTGLAVAPCEAESVDSTEPFWLRDYALCLSGAGTLKAALMPFEGGVEPVGYTLMEPTDFLAHYLAASGERELPAAESYRLFSGAGSFSDDPDLLFQLGMVKVRNRAFTFGMEDMRFALGQGSGPTGYIALGDSFLAAGNPSDAFEAFGQAASHLPENLEARLGKARSLIVLGRADEANELLEQLKEAAPGMKRLNATRSLFFAQKGELKKAIEAMELELAADPSPEYYGRLAGLLMADAQQERALDLISKGSKEYPDSLALLRLLGRVMLESGRHEQAEARLVHLLEKEPGDEEAWTHLAVSRILLEKAGKQGKQSAAETVKELNRRFSRALYRVAVILSARGMTDDAERLLESRLEKEPDNALLTTWLYYMYRLHGRAARAEEIKKKAYASFEDEKGEWVEATFERVDTYVEALKTKQGTAGSAGTSGKEEDAEK